MNDLYQEIIKNTTLNRNVSTLIESYLLDPPVLPFLEELYNSTNWIADLPYYWYYEKYRVSIYNHCRSNHNKARLHKRSNKLWLIERL